MILQNTQIHGQKQGEQRIRATEGMPAYITIGQQIPVTTIETDNKNNRWTQTQYQNVDRRLEVIARVHDSRVILEIRHNAGEVIQQDGKSSATPVIKTSKLETSVTGQVGQWIQLGGTLRNNARNSNGIASKANSTSNTSESVRVKVVIIQQ